MAGIEGAHLLRRPCHSSVPVSRKRAVNQAAEQASKRPIEKPGKQAGKRLIK